LVIDCTLHVTAACVLCTVLANRSAEAVIIVLTVHCICVSSVVSNYQIAGWAVYGNCSIAPPLIHVCETAEL